MTTVPERWDDIVNRTASVRRDGLSMSEQATLHRLAKKGGYELWKDGWRVSMQAVDRRAREHVESKDQS